MILAMSKREDESAPGAEAVSASKGTENTPANDAGVSASAAPTAASGTAVQAGDNRESTGRRRSRRSTRTAGSPSAPASTGAESTDGDTGSAKKQPASAPVAAPDVTAEELAAQPRRRGRRTIVRGDAPVTTPARDVGDAAAAAPGPVAGDGNVVDAEIDVPASGDELATAPRKRARRRVVRKDAAATVGEPVAEVATAEPVPAPEPVQPESAAATSEATAEPEAPKRRSRRRVTRTAGAAEQAAPATQTVDAPASHSTTEGVGSVTELAGHEVEVAAEASELAVVNKRKRQARRTVKRPTGDA